MFPNKTLKKWHNNRGNDFCRILCVDSDLLQTGNKNHFCHAIHD